MSAQSTDTCAVYGEWTAGAAKTLHVRSSCAARIKSLRDDRRRARSIAESRKFTLLLMADEKSVEVVEGKKT